MDPASTQYNPSHMLKKVKLYNSVPMVGPEDSSYKDLSLFNYIHGFDLAFPGQDNPLINYVHEDFKSPNPIFKAIQYYSRQRFLNPQAFETYVNPPQDYYGTTWYISENMRYYGDFVNGKFEGPGHCTRELYNIKGNFFNGAPNGECSIIFKNGIEYNGSVKAGLPHGVGAYYFPRFMILGTFINGSANGKFICKFGDNWKFNLNFKADQFSLPYDENSQNVIILQMKKLNFFDPMNKLSDLRDILLNLK
jgi:hypothetical protein